MEIRDALKVLQHHKPPELYSMKDILSLYFVLFANDEPPRNIAPQRMLRRNSQQYVPALLSRPVITPHPASYVANNTSLGTPKRWPLSLKYVPYNLYWVKLSNTPCIGLSLDFSSQGSSSLEPSLRVLPFHCETPYKEQLFRCKSLSHFDEIIARQSTEKRTIEFALALKDFAQYELAAYSHCKWYIYPQFVINLISSSAEWKRWRMEVERTLGRNHNRRDAYFSALLADSERFRDQDDRTMTDDYPWNDEDGPQLENKKRKDPSDDGTFTSPTEQPPQKKSISTPQKHKGDSLALLGAPNNSLTSPSNQNHSITRAETPPTSVTKPKRPKCLSNLYWVSKIGLPCIYYGNPGEESNESINLLPISSLTNHYDVRVRYTELTELTSENLIYCHDEKTRDFAQSLISFYEWDRSRLKDNENVIDKPYTWPDLILDLIVHRDKWRPWSKEVEKRLPLMPKLKGKNMRCLAYFEKLKEQYQESLNNNTLESGSEIDESSDTEKYKRSRKKKKILSNSTTTSTSNDITNIDEEKNKIILSLSDHQTTIREKSFKLSNDTTSIHPYTTGNDRTFLDLFPSKLYWLPKLGLPAIFYDDFNKKFENSVCVYPISTITPRYFLECKLSDLQPLNLHNLGTCLEEKTREFANSLILFYDWKILHKIDKESNEQQQEHEQQRQDEEDEEEDVVFQWPDFILDIISDFTKWKSFSRQAEKRLLQVGLEKLTKQYGNLVTARIHNYFETLKEFYSLDHQEYPSESIPTSNIITTTTTSLTPDSVAPIPNSPCNPIMIASPSPASVRSTSSDHDSIVEIIPSSSLSPRFLEEDVSDADRWKIK